MISLIIPTYNEAAVIEDTLERAAASLRSAAEDFEIVVVDDASADGTAELAESLAGKSRCACCGVRGGWGWPRRCSMDGRWRAARSGG